MIKAGGIWVSPAEVESVLVEHPDVLEAAVVGARNEAGLEIVVAFVVPEGRPHHRRRRASTPTAASAWPPSSARARSCRRRSLPKTATGKIQRYALRAPAGRPGLTAQRGCGTGTGTSEVDTCPR